MSELGVSPDVALGNLVARIRACRHCAGAAASGRPLAHEPRPVLRTSASARLLIAGQAPGTRVQASGIPFSDPSGERLRAWMGVDDETFYDDTRIAILPMGFCFPGLDAKGGDLPPRRECAPLWRDEVLGHLAHLGLVLMVGGYAQRWHLGRLDPLLARRPLTEIVARWREVMALCDQPRLVPLPHPSWRNNAWIRRNPWFEAELLPALRREVAAALAGTLKRPPRHR
ncbi:MAG: uracil-DNA glycosylase family protein [Hyphomicrobiaceae bacterium]